MLRILSWEKQTSGTLLTVESDEFMPDDPTADIRYILADGILETYQEHYGYPAGASLTALLIDAFYDDVDMPHWETDYSAEFERIVAMAPDRLEWQCDRNELLSTITLAVDNPDSVAGSWSAIKADMADNMRGFHRRQEELLADDWMGVIRDGRRGAVTTESGDVVSLGNDEPVMRVEW